MGASFQAVTFRHNDRIKISKDFDVMAEQERHQSGHSYSGTIGELRGAIRWNDLKLEDERAANDWLEEHHQKWDGPMAVSFKGGAVSEANKKKGQDLYNESWGVERQINEAVREAILAVRAKGGFVKCSGCQSRLNAEKLQIDNCPLCGTSLLGKREQNKIQRLKDEVKALRDKSQALHKPENNGEVWWLVGGWCSS